MLVTFVKTNVCDVVVETRCNGSGDGGCCCCCCCGGGDSVFCGGDGLGGEDTCNAWEECDRVARRRENHLVGSFNSMSTTPFLGDDAASFFSGVCGDGALLMVLLAVGAGDAGRCVSFSIFFASSKVTSTGGGTYSNNDAFRVVGSAVF